MDGPIRVFLGSGTRHLVEESVMARSLLAHATRDVEIEVIDGETHCTRNVRTGRTKPLPDAWRGRIQGNTVFSFARFAPPVLCGFSGRAIYCESDMLALGDVAELWERPLDGASFAAVPHAALRSAESPFQTGGYLSSVVLFDASRCRGLDVVAVTDCVQDGRVTYQDAICLTDRFLTEMRLEVSPLPAMWNDLERELDDTKILHFTDFDRRPWLHPKQPAGGTWTDAYVSCVQHGDLDQEQLRAAGRSGTVSTRVAWLPRLPNWCRGPVDRIWQQLEHEVIRVSDVPRRSRRLGVHIVRRCRRLLIARLSVLRRDT